jgi:apolipoprotein N-acyltransferase
MQSIALASFSALLLSFSGRPWGSPYIALIALVPTFFALSKEKSMWRGAAISYILTLPVFVVGFEGLVVKAPLAFYIVVFALSLCFTLPGVLTVWIHKKFGEQTALWAFTLLWVAVETLSGSVKLWENWANPLSIGLSQVGSILLQAAFWAGMPLVAFYVLVFNLGIFCSFSGNLKPLSAIISSALIFVVTPYFLRSSSQEGVISLGIVQGKLTNIEMVAASFSFHEQEKLVSKYLELTEELRQKHPTVDLVTWPEAASGWYTNYLSSFSSSRMLFPKDLPLIAGSYGSSYEGMTNSILFWNGSDYNFAYNKLFPVPVYEDFIAAGKGYTQDLVNIDSQKMGLGICWESLYPELSRQSVKQGATMLFYLSDDTFAGNSVTSWYHMRSSSVRAIETNRYVIFASQSGPSGVFTPIGEQILQTEKGEGYWVAEIPKTEPSTTPFVILGNWFGWLCVFISTSFIAITLFTRNGKLSPLPA